MTYDDPFRNISPYANANSTGAAQSLAQHDKLMREARASHEIDRLMHEVKDLRYQIDMMERRIYPQVSMRPIMFEDIDDEPEPSVEYSEPSTFWRDLFADPFFEIFKRPSIKYH